MSKKILINIISFKFISELCGMLVTATGIFAIIGWLAGSVILTGIRAVYIPMAPNTAISFILLGTSLAFLITEKRPLHKLSKIGAIVVFVLSLFRLAEFSLSNL